MEDPLIELGHDEGSREVVHLPERGDNSRCSRCDECRCESREPGYTGIRDYGFSCHKVSGDGIKLDGDTCDRDWFRVELTFDRTYKLQLESGTDVLIDGVYHSAGNPSTTDGKTYTARRSGIHYISVAGTDGCSGLHGCTGSYTLRVTEE